MSVLEAFDPLLMERDDADRAEEGEYENNDSDEAIYEEIDDDKVGKGAGGSIRSYSTAGGANR